MSGGVDGLNNTVNDVAPTGTNADAFGSGSIGLRCDTNRETARNN
ncbi:hypothetical protein [Marilutibacter alkalisoli]|nr:hypothetical protein [Lysobacter alkalisoli]